MVHASRNHPSKILVRTDAPKVSCLLLTCFSLCILLDKRIPITSEHRVGLAATCLPIWQKCYVVTFSNFCYYRADIIVQLFLGWFFWKGFVHCLTRNIRRVADFNRLPLEFPILVHSTWQSRIIANRLQKREEVVPWLSPGYWFVDSVYLRVLWAYLLYPWIHCHALAL